MASSPLSSTWVNTFCGTELCYCKPRWVNSESGILGQKLEKGKNNFKSLQWPYLKHWILPLFEASLHCSKHTLLMSSLTPRYKVIFPSSEPWWIYFTWHSASPGSFQVMSGHLWSIYLINQTRRKSSWICFYLRPWLIWQTWVWLTSHSLRTMSYTLWGM